MDDPAPAAGPQAPELLTPAEAARRLGICTRTLYAHVKAGDLGCTIVGGSPTRANRMFTPAHLEGFCDRKRMRETPTGRVLVVTPPEPRAKAPRPKPKAKAKPHAKNAAGGTGLGRRAAAAQRRARIAAALLAAPKPPR